MIVLAHISRISVSYFGNLLEPLPPSEEVIVRHLLNSLLITESSIGLLVQMAFLNLDFFQVLNTAYLWSLSDVGMGGAHLVRNLYWLPSLRLTMGCTLIPLEAKSGVQDGLEKVVSHFF